MTREEIAESLKLLKEQALKSHNDTAILDVKVESFVWVVESAIKALSQEPCDDAISREAVLDTTICEGISCNECSFNEIDGESGCLLHARIDELPSVTQKSGKCKDCKWWRDSDGVYRRGVGAESKCPINNVSVNHGFGYCYMFEPQESEEQTE